MRLKNSKFRLHPDAQIFMCTGDGLQSYMNTNSPELVFFHPPWHVGVRYALRLLVQTRKLKSNGVDVVICANQKSEVRLLRVLGVRCVYLNQNLHLPENLYRPVERVDNRYDAVYTAQARPFKRMHLAKDVSRLYVLTYGAKSNSDGENDLLASEPLLVEADFNKGFIHDKEEISRLYAAASCGLALSKKEGAMWASMEYLMAGLPVVTTKNIGGRNRYFQPSYAKEVSDSSEEVKKAVDFFVQNPPDRKMIRESVLEMVEADRKSFLDMVNKLAQERGFDATNSEYIWGGGDGILTRHELIVSEKSKMSS
jgi:glycosyltransferase involved in cell wall biosynthesis